MGRQVKRVPLDFNWPLNKIWKGYLNPHYKQCPDCENGSTASREALSRIVQLLLIAGSDSLFRPENFRPTGRPVEVTHWPGSTHTRPDPRTHARIPHPYLIEAGINDPGKEFHELSTALAGRPPSGMMGHDAIDRWHATDKILKAAGLPKTWGQCQTCKGEAIDPANKAAYDAWKEEDPPAGPGWQMWETVSEGSPISPVFKTAEELARWLVANRTGVDAGATYEQWLGMIQVGHAPSAIRDGKGYRSGVEAVGDYANEGKAP